MNEQPPVAFKDAIEHLITFATAGLSQEQEFLND